MRTTDDGVPVWAYDMPAEQRGDGITAGAEHHGLEFARVNAGRLGHQRKRQMIDATQRGRRRYRQ